MKTFCYGSFWGGREMAYFATPFLFILCFTCIKDAFMVQYMVGLCEKIYF